MAKKQFGKLAVLAALAGTAVGITYFLRYKSFHEELEEDFHDFEEDLDEFDSKEEEASAKRNYVSLTPEKADSAQKETTKSGIVLPGQAKEKPQQAEVIAVGPGGVVDGKEVSMQVKVGDKVIYSKYSGTEVEVEDEKYVVVKQNDILAVF